MKQAGRTALRIGMIVLISLTLGGGVYLWNARTIGHNEMPMPFGIGMAVALLAIPDHRQRGVVAQCAFRSNFAILGLPLVGYVCKENTSKILQ